MAVKERHAEVRSGDVLKSTFEIKFDQHAFTARLGVGRVDFFWPGEPEPFGYLRPGSIKSGSIWLGDECIGEYDEFDEKRAIVMPIVDGRALVDKPVEIDPVTFLVHSEVERRKKAEGAA